MKDLTFNAELEKAGLTPREAAIYESVLRNGEPSLSALVGKLGLHPQVVYRAVKHLTELGLLHVFLRRNKKHVRAEDPSILLRQQEASLAQFRKALPLMKDLGRRAQGSIINVRKGTDAIFEVRSRAINELKKGDALYIIGASGDRYYDIVGRRHKTLEEKRIKKGVSKRLIAFESQRGMLDDRDPYRKLAQFRYLPNSFSVPSSTNIFKNTVAIFIWGDEPAAITIESPEVAQSYRQYFDELWRNARK